MAETDLNDAPATAARDKAVVRDQVPGDQANVATAVVTIDKPAQDLYTFWRDFSNLSGIMENVEAITVGAGGRSHWIVKAPGGRTVEWDAEVIEDEPGRVIGWRSVEGAEINNSGRVEFHDVPGRGSVVRAVIGYDVPGGAIGQFIAKLFQREPAIQARRDLRRFKQFMEAGEVSTSARTRAHAAEHQAG